jgi:hypothetical protein
LLFSDRQQQKLKSEIGDWAGVALFPPCFQRGAGGPKSAREFGPDLTSFLRASGFRCRVRWGARRVGAQTEKSCEAVLDPRGISYRIGLYEVTNDMT